MAEGNLNTTKILLGIMAVVARLADLSTHEARAGVTCAVQSLFTGRRASTEAPAI
jgi:hypothetical protein